MKRHILFILAFLYATSFAFGDVVPRIIHLKNADYKYTTTYTVPPGKVFVLHAAWCDLGSIELVSPDGTVDLIYGTPSGVAPKTLANPVMKLYQPALWIPAGYKLRVESSANNATLYGAEVLPTDLHVETSSLPGSLTAFESALRVQADIDHKYRIERPAQQENVRI